mmetsp:Transcript_26495/g.37616  ORF Transcript_26495/g.37616 Transcript_26495/m.37616 type:complete len:159 (+) Transcript_26495:53-529(+)
MTGMMGFEDLSPQQLADDAFGHLREGDNISFTMRGNNIESVQPYIDVFEKRKIRVRVVKNQNDLQDFCYLMSAEKEYLAYTVSTFGVWAGWLGNASKVRLYTIQSSKRVKRWGDNWNLTFDLSNPVVRDRIHFEVYKTAEFIEQEMKEKEGAEEQSGP